MEKTNVYDRARGVVRELGSAISLTAIEQKRSREVRTHAPHPATPTRAPRCAPSPGAWDEGSSGPRASGTSRRLHRARFPPH